MANELDEVEYLDEAGQAGDKKNNKTIPAKLLEKLQGQDLNQIRDKVNAIIELVNGATTTLPSESPIAKKDISNVNVGSSNKGKLLQVKDDGSLEFVNDLWSDIPSGKIYSIGEKVSGNQYYGLGALGSQHYGSSARGEQVFGEDARGNIGLARYYNPSSGKDARMYSQNDPATGVTFDEIIKAVKTARKLNGGKLDGEK